MALEVKYSDAPRLTQSMSSVLKELNLDRLLVVYPGDRTYPLSEKITVVPLSEVIPLLQESP